MLDEGELRRRFPELPWDQPVKVTTFHVGGNKEISWWVCRYCIALHGLKAAEALAGQVDFVYDERAAALDHIEQRHHD